MTSKVQSVRFDRAKWSEGDAQRWLGSHGYRPIKAVDVTRHQLRYRITPPSRYKRMVALEPKLKSGAPSSKGVSFILGFR